MLAGGGLITVAGNRHRLGKMRRFVLTTHLFVVTTTRKTVFQTSKRPDKSRRLPEHFRGVHAGAASEMFNYNTAPETCRLRPWL
ncbi:hypothetical protein DND90_14945 [Pseudomonas syringae pv. maculicola]|nr:hypothetical protein DND90_14945 [Pseudomonas syringae pv. maculicola]